MSTQTPTQPETEPASPPARSKAKPLIIGLVVILIIGGVIAWLHFRNRQDTDDAQIQGHLESVAPRIPGQVVEVDVNDNEIVRPGQVLFRLDDHDYRAAVQQAQANLQAAQAALGGARTGVPITLASSAGALTGAQANLQAAQAGETLAQRQADAARSQVVSAQAQLAQAQAQSANAASNQSRYAQLVAKDEVSQLQYDQIVTQAKAAAAAVDAAQAQVQTATQQADSAAAQIQVARGRIAQAAAAVRSAASAPEQQAASRAQAAAAAARVAQAQAALAEAQLNLDYTVVTAPTGGQVGDKHLELGQDLSPGQTTLTIVPVNEVWVIANFKETQLQDMRVGQRADISVDAYGATLQGQVNSIGAGTGDIFSLLPPENATGNYVKVVQRIPVKLVFLASQDLSKLRPGMSVEATVFTK